MSVIAITTDAVADLRAGVGVVDITPPSGTPLGGYSARRGKPMEGVHDRIFAKSLALDDGKTRVLIITTDLIGSDIAFHRAIAEATSLPPGNVMLCASHTHSGPGALANNLFATTAMGAFNQELYDWMRDRLIESAKKAVSSLAPARLAAGIGELQGYSRNRRKDCTVIDPQLTVLRVDRADGSPLAGLVNFSAHGTVLGADNMLVSGDWMGSMQRALEKLIGNGVVALYANGAEGDQSPSPPEEADMFERCDLMGTAVAREAKKMYDVLRPAKAVSIRALAEEIELPATAKSILLGKKKSLIQLILLTVANKRIALIALPGEVIAPLGIDIKRRVARFGFVPVAMGLANDYLGYILTEEEYAKGGYEVQVSFYGEKFGAQLAEAIAKLAEKAR